MAAGQAKRQTRQRLTDAQDQPLYPSKVAAAITASPIESNLQLWRRTIQNTLFHDCRNEYLGSILTSGDIKLRTLKMTYRRMQSWAS